MSINTNNVKTLLNNLNLGTFEANAGDYVVGTLQQAAAVAPIASPSTATTTQIATAFNNLIAALQPPSS